jgi:predicted secreted hydrolase
MALRHLLVFFWLLTSGFWLLPPAAHADDPQFSPVLQPRTWSFPRDHGRHDGFKTEWWYFTGNLREKSTGRRFGYQLTFFRSSQVPNATTRPSPWAAHDLYFAHAAISDVQSHRFLDADRLSRGRPGLAHASDQTMDVVLKDWWTKLDDQGHFRLFARDDQLAIDLTATSHAGAERASSTSTRRPGSPSVDRGPILQGPGGVNAKGPNPGQASYYYSMTRLPTSGTLTVAGRSFDVEGLSWLDREFSSNALADNQSGWDWLALTLDDGTDLMLYRLRDKAGQTDYLSGTRIGPAGHVTYLSVKDITLTPSSPWKSPASGASYPQHWTITCPGVPTLTVQTRIPNQELQTPNSTDVTYYEGTVEVTDPSGKTSGDGYLEMTGYAKSLTR